MAKRKKRRKTWRYTYRQINGKRRRVKVKRKANGNEFVRVVGHKNYSDKSRIRRLR